MLFKAHHQVILGYLKVSSSFCLATLALNLFTSVFADVKSAPLHQSSARLDFFRKQNVELRMANPTHRVDGQERDGGLPQVRQHPFDVIG